MLLRASEVVLDAGSPYQGTLLRKSFRGSQYLYTLALMDDLQVYAQVSSQIDHPIGTRVGLQARPINLVRFPGNT
ncbi:hypothetical protein D3C71_1917130 [compost metagenome]